MAQVSDSIAATVTVKTGAAIKDLGAVARKAKEADRAFNEVGKGSAAAGVKIGDGANKGAKGVDNLGRSTKQTVGRLGEIRGTIQPVQNLASTFGAATAAVGFLTLGAKSALDAQTRLTTATASSKSTFKDAAGQVEEFAKHATSIGFSKRAALEAATGFGTLFRGLQFSTKAAADFSVSLTQLSSDLASKVGGSAEEAADALRAMFRGEFDPIEKYGVKVGEAAVATRALQLGLAGSKGELTEQDKTLARLTLAYTQTADAQGDFTRRQAETANQQRIVAATSENVRASLGAALNPSYADVLKGLGSAFGVADKAAGSFGTSLGGLVRDLPLASGLLGSIGKLTKDNAGNFKTSEDALRTFSQELAAGREGSEAYRAAVSYLKRANEEAETAANKLGDAIGGQASKMAAARTAAQANLGSIQSLTAAYRGEHDAMIRVSDSRRNLVDAERSLSELRARGKVDADKVADAELRVRDASQSTAEARYRSGEAERRLRDLRAKGAVDADRVADAERSIAEASRGVADARRSVAEAEREVSRLRAGPTGDEAADAARAITRAQLDLERAQQRQLESLNALNESRGSDTLDAALGVREADLGLVEAQNALREAQEAQIALNQRGAEGSSVLAEAELRLQDARERELDAVHRQTEAEGALREARAGDPDFGDKLAAAVREVEAARRGVESAERAEKTASDELRAARAGDPEFERNLARANDEVTRARLELRRAEQDLPAATIAARLAQEDFNAKVSEGTDAADRLRDMAYRLGATYMWTAGAADRAAGAIRAMNTAGGQTLGPTSNNGSVIGSILGSVFGPGGALAGSILGREHGGRVAAGEPYIVGEKRPELFVPDGPGTIMPRVPSGSSGSATTIVVPVVLDGQEVARIVTRHQNGSSKRGGDVRTR